MTFSNNHFITTRDVINKVKYQFKNSELHLYDDHNKKLNAEAKIEHARSYTLKRLPQKT